MTSDATENSGFCEQDPVWLSEKELATGCWLPLLSLKASGTGETHSWGFGLDVASPELLTALGDPGF